MSTRKTFQDLFQRYRRPGDFILSLAAFIFALFLLESMSRQTTWIDGQALFAQPSFWPRIAIYAMVLFSGLH
ncbi:MAG: tripartite tricarboxylate transporter TctB family protein, partial [Pseudomonadota bacterium]|nr:tripartite tricarboxylate transporter TctB family protein [Pseudomonadota bacterium]